MEHIGRNNIYYTITNLQRRPTVECIYVCALSASKSLPYVHPSNVGVLQQQQQHMEKYSFAEPLRSVARTALRCDRGSTSRVLYVAVATAAAADAAEIFFSFRVSPRVDTENLQSPSV